jgi:hypothetical protein
MDFDTTVKVTIYRITAGTGTPPSAADVAAHVAADASAVKGAFTRLRAKRLLFLDPDGEIRMAPPFSSIPTQHRVTVGDMDYYAPCAWDALGIGAALHRPALVQSQCAESHEPLRLSIGLDGPEPSSWLFHCLVPAAQWWDDLVFT